MKKTVMIVLVVLLAGIAYGAPNTGTWTAPAEFHAGNWEELFDGGGPGKTGNEDTSIHVNICERSSLRA